MASPRIAKSLAVLRSQVDAMAPARAKDNDGWLGDARHQATKSEHNPDASGVVRALDITNDPDHGVNARALAQRLLNSRDPRILYMISNGEIQSSVVAPWTWRPYHGVNDHSHHFHLSVVGDPKLYDDTRPWELGGPTVQLPGVPFPHSGRGSWYSQFKGRYTWVDPGDRPGSAALGCPDDAQGVAFYDRSTLGTWFEVRAPNGAISIEQQTDIGPHPATGRQIDISAAAAERFGYSPKNFPTDGVFSWRPVTTPAIVRDLTPPQQAVEFRDLRPAVPTKPPIAGPVVIGTGAAGAAAALIYNGQFVMAAVLVIAVVIGLVLLFRLRS